MGSKIVTLHEAPYLGKVLKGSGCQKCRQDKLKVSASYTMSKVEFEKSLHTKNPEGRIIYYNSFFKPAKIKCLKCGCSRTDIASNLIQTGCQDCKTYKLGSLKKNRSKAYRIELIKRKEAGNAEHVKVLYARMLTSEHIKPQAEPYLGKRGHWQCRVQCNYCTAVFTALTSNVHKGSKCRKCSMRWAKTKTVKLGSKEFKVQGYEPQALKYIIEQGVKPSEIEVERVPRIPYKWQNKTKWYYPDAIVKGKIIVEVKSTMTLGLGSWWGKGVPPFERNKEKHKAVIAAGFKFKLLVCDAKGCVAVLPSNWLIMSKLQVKKYLLNLGIK